jgi:hypothetical protein
MTASLKCNELGMEPKQKKEVNDKEPENLADIIEQAMFQDYKQTFYISQRALSYAI